MQYAPVSNLEGYGKEQLLWAYLLFCIAPTKYVLDSVLINLYMHPHSCFVLAYTGT